MKKILGVALIASLVLGGASSVFAQEVNCTPHSVEVVSDTTNTVQGAGNAVAVTFIHPAWTASVPGATWIWSVDPVANPTLEETATFEKQFTVVGTPTAATLDIASDNSYQVWVNGTLIGADASENNHALATQDQYTASVLGALVEGLNTITIEVKNWEQPGGNAQSNPAGLLYKLVVDSEECENPNTIKVINNNGADVVNNVIVKASTGGNDANGGNAGSAGNGGSVNSSDSENVGGVGGNSGNGGVGGIIVTGGAEAGASVTNLVNYNVTRVNGCNCGADLIKAKNNNGASVTNNVGVKAKTGKNNANGGNVGGGYVLLIDNEINGGTGNGGSVNNSNDQNQGGADGNSGNGGAGGTIITGPAFSVASILNTINSNLITIGSEAEE
ncbi:MAG: hypothetical protein KGZ30_02050 [Anaplasmataceae bacterium]|nr:hypothetical protein [Anaplasmataceae bacterium]